MKPLALFYDECIKSKIALCELKAKRSNGNSQCIKRRAEISLAQATFFEEEREQLVSEMIERQEFLGRDLARICSFLNRTFYLSFPKVTQLEDSSHSSEMLADYITFHPWSEEDGKDTAKPVTLAVDSYFYRNCTLASHESNWSDGFLIDDEDS